MLSEQRVQFVHRCGAPRKLHPYDLRGTFGTKLTATTGLADREIAEIMGWSPDEVTRIRKVYVDQEARVVAIGRRISGAR